MCRHVYIFIVMIKNEIQNNFFYCLFVKPFPLTELFNKTQPNKNRFIDLLLSSSSPAGGSIKTASNLVRRVVQCTHASQQCDRFLHLCAADWRDNHLTM